MRCLESCYKVAALANMMVFIRQGRWGLGAQAVRRLALAVHVRVCMQSWLHVWQYEFSSHKG
jgi:hypothetical protein